MHMEIKIKPKSLVVDALTRKFLNQKMKRLYHNISSHSRSTIVIEIVLTQVKKNEVTADFYLKVDGVEFQVHKSAPYVREAIKSGTSTLIRSYNGWRDKKSRRKHQSNRDRRVDKSIQLLTKSDGLSDLESAESIKESSIYDEILYLTVKTLNRPENLFLKKERYFDVFDIASEVFIEILSSNEDLEWFEKDAETVLLPIIEKTISLHKENILRYQNLFKKIGFTPAEKFEGKGDSPQDLQDSTSIEYAKV